MACDDMVGREFVQWRQRRVAQALDHISATRLERSARRPPYLGTARPQPWRGAGQGHADGLRAQPFDRRRVIARLRTKGSNSGGSRRNCAAASVQYPSGHHQGSCRHIPRSRHNPKISGVDDAEVVGDRVGEPGPIFGNFVAQEAEGRIGELPACGVTCVVRDMPVHEAP